MVAKIVLCKDCKYIDRAETTLPLCNNPDVPPGSWVTGSRPTCHEARRGWAHSCGQSGKLFGAKVCDPIARQIDPPSEEIQNGSLGLDHEKERTHALARHIRTSVARDNLYGPADAYLEGLHAGRMIALECYLPNDQWVLMGIRNEIKMIKEQAHRLFPTPLPMSLRRQA